MTRADIIRAWCASCGMPAPSNGDCIALIAALRPAEVDLLSALQNLNALVWGECPSLLNEDQGGNSGLAMQIEDAIAKAGDAS